MKSERKAMLSGRFIYTGKNILATNMTNHKAADKTITAKREHLDFQSKV